MRKTKIIAFEGIDGSGKTLQWDLLTARLRSEGYRVGTQSFPIYESFFGSQVGRLLRGQPLRADEIDSRSMCLWYALDRFKGFESYRDGEFDFLLINRFTPSNAVYQCIRPIDEGMEDNWEWVKELEHGQLGLPVPDLYLLIDLDAGLAQANVDRKSKREYIEAGARDVYEEQRGLLQRARARYLDIAAREDNFTVIPGQSGEGGQDAPEVIAQRIWQALRMRGMLS